MSTSPKFKRILFSEPEASSSQVDPSEEETVCTPSQVSQKDYSVVLISKTKLDPTARFQPFPERSFTAQMATLNRKEHSCVELLKQHREADNQPISNLSYLNFARFYNFNPRKARKGLRNFDKRYLSLTVAKVGPILQTKALFPIPGLKSKDGLDMFYMRPSRYFPKRVHPKFIIDNLAYVMLTMIEKEANAVNGIGFLACMDDWTMENFTVDYCYQFMMMLQGGVPARVGWFFIVNPPNWFGAIWRIMKPMLAPKFRRKVKMISESDLQQFLTPGYEEFLPDDMRTGRANTKQMVKDFVAYRRQLEHSNNDSATKRRDL